VTGPAVTCVGEALAVLIPDEDTAENEDAAGYALAVGGAEVNVACTLAALGVPARWVGRVGDDRFGRVILRTLAAHGVDVSEVEVDPRRQTGLYVKEIITSRAGAPVDSPCTVMRYYRAGSAACAMNPSLAEAGAVRETPVLHFTGITAALSDSCAALADAFLASPQPGRIVAFDVNFRPVLWTRRDPAVLLDLARRADLVFIGADEAEAICGVSDPQELRRLLPEPRTLVVKQGADGATGFEAGERVDVPALPVEIAEPTGAGDAFAAGFIAGTLRGLSLRDRLRLGTLAASCALRVRGDLGAMPDRASIERFIAAGDIQGRDGEPAPGSEIEAGAA
jgi:2-dehydro-3-deoxygluconokinase